MTTLGMDTAAGLAASQALDSGSDQIAAIAQRLDNALHAFEWHGTDAERTRDAWLGTERPTLDSTAQHLAALAVLIRREAEAQDAASGDGRSHGGAAPTAAAPGGVLGFLSHLGSTAGHFVGSRLDAAFEGLKRTAGHYGEYLEKVGDVLTGREDHSVAEIAASALATLGAGVGTAVNLVTGEDEHWFGEGPGLAGTPVATPTDPLRATQFQPVLTRPTDLPSLMQSVTDSYQVGEGPGSTGDVRITRIDNGTGPPSYVVAIPGTERWGPDAGPVGRDLSANLNLVAGTPTAAAESVQRAMDAAGIPAGSPVLLVGHSQGGIIAGQLASDPAFVQRYGVTDVLTYGAPIDHLDLAPGVQALQVQHRFDVVPRLDLGGVDVAGVNPDHPVPVVTLDSPGSFWDVVTSHSHSEYRDSVREALGTDTEAGRILRDYQATLSPFLLTPEGSATAVDVPVSRGE
ncbi:hypothetical protein BH11ACT8_BH11ACT8_36140 [soil metagenome]